MTRSWNPRPSLARQLGQANRGPAGERVGGGPRDSAPVGLERLHAQRRLLREHFGIERLHVQPAVFAQRRYGNGYVQFARAQRRQLRRGCRFPQLQPHTGVAAAEQPYLAGQAAVHGTSDVAQGRAADPSRGGVARQRHGAVRAC